MATIDKNFLARPEFVVLAGENGKTLTATPTPRLVSVGEYEVESYRLRGWNSVIFNNTFQMEYISMAQSNIQANFKTVTPSLYDIMLLNPNFSIQGVEFDTQSISFVGALSFKKFVELNPVHISKLNLRTQNENVLPQQIVIYNPNIFEGQSNKQIIDISSKKTAYQYQNGIITIPDCDIILSRWSAIEFVCSIDVDNGDDGIDVLAENQLFIDITIDKYLSLEKALVENLKLM